MTSILIIDDEPQVLLVLEQILVRQGYEVKKAANGSAGAKIYRETPTDLVITDLLMPEKDGVEAICELRRDFPEVKIIAISGGGRITAEIYLKMAKTLGASYTFKKPIVREGILKAINDLVK